ncbi:hypothetical protein ILUMI_19404 [Ignelater luminosus]|uniref:Uncharacterized protein n=1 Tax=Ignelater luminosus TaxID=2038154 RepID=A0A8K0G5I4_IGNLU|nr:hypothetical protein ILUMI_19404 [Ignelater luminosus]
MYKTRGKPEDPWNKEAAKQEKDLAEAIQVNQIQRNGADQHLQRFLWNPTTRQKEIARRQNNYEQFRMIYQDKLRKSSTSLLKEKKVVDVTCNKQNRIKRNVNRAQTAAPSNCCTKPAILKAPLSSTKTVKVQVPPPHQEAAIFCPPRLGTAQTLPFLHKLKEIEKLEETLVGNKTVSIEGGDQTDFLKELLEAHIEVDVGNAQLEEINRILKAAKLHNGKIWNVVRTLGPVKEEEEPLQENQTNKKETSKKTKEKEETLGKKNRLLLTLNDVNQRIQKMQAKFFSDNRPRYRSVKTRNFIRSNYLKDDVELLYKNKNYDGLGNNKKLDDEDLKLQSNSQEKCNDNFIKEAIFENLTIEEIGTSPFNTIHKFEPEVNFRVPRLNLDSNDDFVKEFTDQTTSPINYDIQPSPIILTYNDKDEMYEHENSFKISANTNQNSDKGISAKSEFKSKLRESILKSNFLMKEFDINPKDMHFDVLHKVPSILENKTSNRMSLLPENIIQRMKNERIAANHAKGRNAKLCTPTAHYVLKDTLYCTE